MAEEIIAYFCDQCGSQTEPDDTAYLCPGCYVDIVQLRALIARYETYGPTAVEDEWPNVLDELRLLVANVVSPSDVVHPAGVGSREPSGAPD